MNNPTFAPLLSGMLAFFGPVSCGYAASEQKSLVRDAGGKIWGSGERPAFPRLRMASEAAGRRPRLQIHRSHLIFFGSRTHCAILAR